jgi:hypothetical protein
MLRLCLAIGIGFYCGPQDEPRKPVEDFKAKVRDARTIPEKALAIRAFGDAEPRDAASAAALARFLSPTPSDISCLLPLTAADALGKFRGCGAASRALMAAAPAYRKLPCVLQRIHAALGRIGHESALGLFEEALRGSDGDAAVAAVQAIARFPAPLAVETIFRQYDDLEKRKAGMGEEARKAAERAQKEMIHALQWISGEKYPTVKELAVWWQRHSAGFREEASKREKSPVAASSGPLPPLLLVELLFRENVGSATANTGVSAGLYPLATLAGAKWTGTCALNGGPSAIEWDKAGGSGAVDLGGGAGLEHLRQMKSFTLTGWVLCMDGREGPAGKEAGAGSRILSWLGKDGVELVWRADGSLQLGINQPADASPARSPAQKVPVANLKAKDQGEAITAAWRFFAVSYDPGLASGQVKFYVGTWQNDAALVSEHDCNRGPAGMKIASHLSIGNVPPALRPAAPERQFRGVLDEIRIFGSMADGAGALGLPEILKVQNRPRE